MRTLPGANPARRPRWNRKLSPLCIALAFAGAARADAPTAPHARTVYTVIQLSPDFFGGAINGKGQVAFTEQTGTVTRARFYDGKIVRDLGTLGGPAATAVDLNDLGQVTGDSTIDAGGETAHAYRWSAATGMVDLGRPGFGRSRGAAINDKGQVVGFNQFDSANPDSGHGFFWSPQTGMLDVGALGPFGSVANAVNDAGMVAGYSEGPQGGPNSVLAFRWTRAGGIHGLGTLPGEFTSTTDINAAGHIVGEAPFTPGTEPHAFLWTQRGGLMDLGTGSNDRSFASAINDHDVVVGETLRRFIGPEYGFIWTRASGLLELKSQSPDVGASATDVNNAGQVVGGIDNHAFLWTRAEGVVDLNTRLRGAPDGLTLRTATAISDNGSIIADASTGLVLLVPQCGCSKLAPTVGAIRSDATGRIGVPLSFSAALRDVDPHDTHKARWSWGDGGADPGIVSEKGAAGSASAQHAYRAPGVYTVTLTVTDSSGKSTSVRTMVEVRGPGASVAAQGWFLSPADASTLGRGRAGVATFALLPDAAPGQAAFRFEAPGISLSSDRVEPQAGGGAALRYAGQGSVNGRAGYRFTVTGTSGAPGGANDRIRVRIWHAAPGSKTDVVDYDNLGGAEAAADAQGGTVLGGGALGAPGA